ncbi:MAG: Phenylalanine--tRNA ligase beta subunit [Chlamydiales bacterium]|nr:Phenylalanine--tRNA ligase beta subunit [Chlamydiales bacterium]MCH9619373.1 Phenylalanine--tRNA ligase beta subunit [Chlamydiales bacterium]MCH9622177.1 Phenylalanine--tRNA ligase beta subunit [Chlamydiales bacterium]
MKFPYSWLNAYLPTKKSATEVADALTQIGLEVDHLDLSGKDPLFSVSLTPNLAHCNSIRGIARELSAFFDQKIERKTTKLKEKGDSIENLISVLVVDKEHCPRYSCRLLTNVNVAPSPSWLCERLEGCGIRPVNNVVDITNLVMLELGQPLHAFDYDRLEGGAITVRHPKKGETLKALDQTEVELEGEMLLICDKKKPIAIGGVIGGLNSEVSDTTTTLLLESAYFEPTQVRRASKKTALQTEASYRFERGVDPNGVLEALDYAASLIAEHCKADVAKGFIDSQATQFQPQEVKCRLSQINRILGTKLSVGEVVTILNRIDLKAIPAKDETITVFAPTYRHDLHDEIDLIEEVARFYGYDNLKKEEKPLYRSGDLLDSAAYQFEKELRKTLLRLGLFEFLTCDLISPTQAEMVLSKELATNALIHVMNPCSQDQSVMRPSLLPALLALIHHNGDHRMPDVAGFEIGRVHTKSGDQIVQQTVASIIMTGKQTPDHWQVKPKQVDFFALKGCVENLLEKESVDHVRFQPSSRHIFHPHRQATIKVEKQEIGVMGEIHPILLQQNGITHPVYFAELNVEDLATLKKSAVKMEPLQTFPGTSLDWTVTVKESVTFDEIVTAFDEKEIPLLQRFSILDVYHGEKLGSGWKNITMRFIYRDTTKTIALETAQECHHQITTSILEKLKEKAKE